ncbi:hypothetical protein [Methylobacterium sp. SyP6R]|uniref:hypothetical protein n=1 Tax=Methylobacterium sp. SyP6R TaxID=2718876 RepID=UPI001F1B58BD|nr:hypothetical protein [Methylobacterium sp. SyP6R]MCF4127612.1 hypothetical protein [Methylobacterium sp. SyP6R]
MPDPTSFALFCAAALVLAVTPGPASVRRLREASGAAMIALGVGLALARRPAA